MIIKKQLIIIGILIGVNCCICNIASLFYIVAPVLFILRPQVTDLSLWSLIILPGTILSVLLGFYIARQSKLSIFITTSLMITVEIIIMILIFSVL
jgi:hypothetical protein